MHVLGFGRLWVNKPLAVPTDAISHSTARLDASVRRFNLPVVRCASLTPLVSASSAPVQGRVEPGRASVPATVPAPHTRRVTMSSVPAPGHAVPPASAPATAPVRPLTSALAYAAFPLTPAAQTARVATTSASPTLPRPVPVPSATQKYRAAAVPAASVLLLESV